MFLDPLGSGTSKPFVDKKDFFNDRRQPSPMHVPMVPLTSTSDPANVSIIIYVVTLRPVVISLLWTQACLKWSSLSFLVNHYTSYLCLSCKSFWVHNAARFVTFFPNIFCAVSWSQLMSRLTLNILKKQGQDSPSSTITVFSTSRVFHWKSSSQRLR